MVANINTRKLIEIIKAEIRLNETKIEELGRLIDSLQQKIDCETARLSGLGESPVSMIVRLSANTATGSYISVPSPNNKRTNTQMPKTR